MDTQEEEAFLIDKVLGARHAVELNRAAQRDLRAEGKRLESHLAECERAAADYMTGNGVKQFETKTHTCDIATTTSIDVPDIDAVPEQFVRTKVTKEPNKILVGELVKTGDLKASNWFQVVESTKITIRSK